MGMSLGDRRSDGGEEQQQQLLLQDLKRHPFKRRKSGGGSSISSSRSSSSSILSDSPSPTLSSAPSRTSLSGGLGGKTFNSRSGRYPSDRNDHRGRPNNNKPPSPSSSSYFSSLASDVTSLETLSDQLSRIRTSDDVENIDFAKLFLPRRRPGSKNTFSSSSSSGGRSSGSGNTSFKRPVGGPASSQTGAGGKKSSLCQLMNMCDSQVSFAGKGAVTVY